MMTIPQGAMNPAPIAGSAMGRYARLRACTILLVDDEEANLDLLEAVLNEAGYLHLVRTSDSRDVTMLAARHAPDLVLLDLHMPHRHGLEVLAELHGTTPPGEYRPVLVLTADVTNEAREYALSLGARDFVTKPFDTMEVLLRVENLLDARVLHVDERRARERAETAEARAALFAEWSRILAASVEPATAAEHLPALIVPRWAAACDVVLDPHATRMHDAATGMRRLSAPIVTSDGVAGSLALVGAGANGYVADQALVDELASRLSMAAENARLLAAAERATRERERLLAVVAHDLRNPLGAVAMYGEMLESLQPDGDADPYVRDALAAIHTSAAAMQRLVEDLLDASSFRGGALRVNRTEQPVGEAFAQAEQIVRPLAERGGLALHVIAMDGAATQSAPIDRERIVQLLSNLVGNAVKFTPRGGTVTVRYAVDDAGIVASVSDTGPGIASDDLPHLFTAFWRGDRRQQRLEDDRRGAGLGLWIAQAIVEAHGGVLRVESRPGAGATFHFTLPFTTPTQRWED